MDFTSSVMDTNRKYKNAHLQARLKRFLEGQQAEQVLRRRKDRRMGGVREQILAAFEGGDAGPLCLHIRRNLGRGKPGLPAYERDVLKRLLLHVASVSSLASSQWTVQPLIRLGRRHREWVRQPEEWKPRSYNGKRQLSSLARHLFARYRVPAFMDAAWTEDNASGRLHQEWFIHVGRGENIRKAAGLPVPLTKMMAHHFLQAADECT